jgi:hypothetical protein
MILNKRLINHKKRNRIAGKHPSYNKLGMTAAQKKRKLAYDTRYQSSALQLKNRSNRNKARSLMIKKGRAKVGDGKDVDHKKSMKSGGSNALSNLRMRSKSTNRGDKTY